MKKSIKRSGFVCTTLLLAGLLLASTAGLVVVGVSKQPEERKIKNGWCSLDDGRPFRCHIKYKRVK